jgi:L-ascorbate metabolism protein UlaG (beta-lactamase superfamily)
MGNSIITDPYNGASVGFPMPAVKADVVTVSHAHDDHSFVTAVSGTPAIIDCVANCCHDDIAISAYGCFHDEAAGAKRGSNIIFRYLIDGIPVAHLGDLGHVDSGVLDFLAGVEVLLVPVGGYFTIDAAAAKQIVDAVKPKIVIPMHYFTEGCKLTKIAPVEDFLKLFDGSSYNIEHSHRDTLELSDIDGDNRIIVLDRMHD